MANQNNATKSIEDVKQYYGQILNSNKDLKTNACCVADAMPPRIRALLKDIHPEVLDKFYGCGSPIPQVLEGKTVLDLGSGSGRDCFLLSKLVGPLGHVIGVDMTHEQVELARKHLDFHTEKFGYRKSNIIFHQGYIEDLESVGIKNSSIDVVISNCVLNLSPNKERVFSEIFRVLKPGGELYFSDVFASRRIPKQLAADPVLLGECLGGALYMEDFRRLMHQAGCRDYRVVATGQISLGSSDIESKIGMIDFYSLTIRAFKLDLEDRCENYGQVAYYLSTIAECPHTFALDDHHTFKVGEPVLICGNTADMLSQTRFAPHFRIIGDKSMHLGPFDCDNSRKTKMKSDAVPGVCC